MTHAIETPYVVEGTTWRCTGCRGLVMESPVGVTCECSAGNCAALEPTDDGLYDRLGIPKPTQTLAYAELAAKVQMLEAVVERMSEVTLAARHMIRTFALQSHKGPVFRLCVDDNDPTPEEAANANILRHAVLDLQALLDGEPTPAFCSPPKKVVN